MLQSDKDMSSHWKTSGFDRCIILIGTSYSLSCHMLRILTAAREECERNDNVVINHHYGNWLVICMITHQTQREHLGTHSFYKNRTLY